MQCTVCWVQGSVTAAACNSLSCCLEPQHASRQRSTTRMAKILCYRESCIPCHEGGPERTWACLERPQANACKSTKIRRGWRPHTASYMYLHALRLTCGLLAAASMFHAPKILAHNVCGLLSTGQHTMRSHAMTSHSKHRALLTRVHGVGEVSRVSSAGTRTGPSSPRTCLQPR